VGDGDRSRRLPLAAEGCAVEGYVGQLRDVMAASLDRLRVPLASRQMLLRGHIPEMERRLGASLIAFLGDNGSPGKS